MKAKYLLLVFLFYIGCSKNEMDQAWLNTLKSMVFFHGLTGKQIIIESNGDVKVPSNEGTGYSIFVFSEANSETEAYYTMNGETGYRGLKIQDRSLYRVGSKADATSGASLSTKKDFVAFYKPIEPPLGTVRN